MILEPLGFILTSGIFFVVNIVSLILIYNFNFESYNDYYKYDFGEIIYLLACCGCLFIGLGASSSLSQKILIEYFLKYKNYKIKNIDEKELEDMKNKNEEKEMVEIKENGKVTNIEKEENPFKNINLDMPGVSLSENFALKDRKFKLPKKDNEKN